MLLALIPLFAKSINFHLRHTIRSTESAPEYKYTKSKYTKYSLETVIQFCVSCSGVDELRRPRNSSGIGIIVLWMGVTIDALDLTSSNKFRWQFNAHRCQYSGNVWVNYDSERSFLIQLIEKKKYQVCGILRNAKDLT